IPRPPNAFMLFRSEYWRQEKTKPQAERDHRQISCTAGELWKQLSPKEQAPFRLLADEEKAKHAERYPEYKYSPVYRRDRPAKR
ncbi:high mobility group box domain-containing protein, partial [Epithele typhae]|uniref:high mobility group box domain-containing protein n=1 Tax=Epithele typhae TaxID=378194 RepID=UPI0020087C75